MLPLSVAFVYSNCLTDDFIPNQITFIFSLKGINTKRHSLKLLHVIPTQENWKFFAANGKCNVYLNILKFCLHIFLQCPYWFCFLFIFSLGNWVLRKHDIEWQFACKTDICAVIAWLGWFNTEKRLQNLSSFDFGILFMRSSWNATIPLKD